MLTRLIFSLTLLVLLALPAQAEEAQPVTSTAITLVVVRHAEKSTDDPRDPTLTDQGRARAQRLAVALSTRDVRAVYSSDYRRTRDTASPAAEQAGVTTILYDPGQAADAFAEQLRSAHGEGVVLIVGHSNTVPALVAALCRCDIDAIDEGDYGNWFEINIDGERRSLLQQQY